MFSFISHIFSSIVAFVTACVMATSAFFFPVQPTCELHVSTPSDTEQTITSEGSVHLFSEESVHITWSSVGADTATVNGTAESAVSGSETFTPQATTTYTYLFKHRGTQVMCSVTVGVEQRKGVQATSSPVAVIPKTPPKVIPPVVKPPVVVPPVVVPPVVTPPVTPPNKPPSVPIGPTTIAVANIPLLSGGTVKGSQTVPVSYLQITNVGKASTIITGFWMTQTGTAPPSTVIGLSTVDDHGGSRGSVGGSEGSSPFSTYTALAPSDAYFEPGQLKLFTIKAKITGDTASIVGTTVTLVVSKVETSASVQGSFPIRGTSWTIAQ